MSLPSIRRAPARFAAPLLALAAFAAASSVSAQEKYDGYLCCNLRSDGNWISDSNYAENGKRVIPAGTPVSITGYGRQRVHLRIDGEKHSIGNDYSRDLDLDAFARRYVVTEDPNVTLATYPAKIQDAIQRAKITPGMTRAQVLMALGYPISSENPDLASNLWRYWLSSFAEFQVQFDEAGRVSDITTDANTRNLVWVP
ncbi:MULTISPECIES: outer membrane protein assembly factor BamE domain-containing protein [Luteimonas]|jgi:outer membrane protein assembly factor BamE (lipoprotein component of BamABCDE complex)|uniref:outer membrane protein assembly factor BamE domain-containing protein n=1 Tax=Luteimonas TaxID=83614 RepID=UPI000C7B85AD|nr:MULTISPECIES: outer membrane protein assembly factor BamE [Luteimonas]